MRFKGHNVRRTRAWGWRHCKDGDINERGRQIDGCYVIIVKISDCRLYEREGRSYYDASNAPAAFPHAHSRTDMVYGKRHNVYDAWTAKWARDEKGNDVYTYSYSYVDLFVVKDGQVYKGRCGYRQIAPKGEVAA